MAGKFNWHRTLTKNTVQSRASIVENSAASEIERESLDISLSENQKVLHQLFKGCSDVIFREFAIGEHIRAVVIWTDGLVDKFMLNEEIVGSLMHESHLLDPEGDLPAIRLFPLIRDSLLNVSDIKEQQKFADIIDSILTGESVVIADGIPSALIISTKGWEGRSVSEPITEGVVRGPREGFVENIRTNTALIRRIVKTPQLKMENFKVGTLTKTTVIVGYIEGLADEKVLGEVRQRINRISVDSILESGYLEELIEDHPYSPFPQIAHTERPDKAAAHLLEGRVVILTDGTPFVLLLPSLFIQFLQSNEDYYERFFMAFAVRCIRFLFFVMSLLLPSSYVAATTYHQEMLPTPLLISIAASHEGVPFPAFIEALLMEITFEALREAGVRLPRPVGQAVSIVGALVIGEAAVRAGIVSASMVIVVAVTAIASFTVPAFNMGISIRILRFPMIVLAGVFGFYGISIGILAILIHLCSLRSFGVPYFAPLGPFIIKDMKDLVLRFPWWAMDRRSQLFGKGNRRRQKTKKPGPSSG